MENLNIEGTKQTPRVRFQTNGQLEISGLSFPEFIDEFYAPILEWVKDYIDNPQKETVLSLKMDYLNKPSSKQILYILKKLEILLSRQLMLKTIWYYSEDDEDMEETGNDFSMLVKMPFIMKSTDK